MQFEDWISAERLKIYTEVLKLKPEEATGGYNWNKSLSAAMQPLIHCLEVTLRNAIDYSIRHNPPPGAAGLWHTDTRWIFDLPRYMGDKTYTRQGKRYRIDPQGQRMLQPDGSPKYHFTAWEEDAIRKVSRRIRHAGKPVTAARVISGLDFGFWVNLLDAEYHEPRKCSLLWPHLLDDVFPGRPAGTQRHQLAAKFSRIRELRNRLAHHEAIWKFHEESAQGQADYTRPVYGLNASLQLLRRAWDDMLEALYWISPERHAAFLAEQHCVRFNTLASINGLRCFTEIKQIENCLDVRRSSEVRRLLRELRRQKMVRLTSGGRTLAVIGGDFSRLWQGMATWS